MNICLVVISDAWAGAETVVHELARHCRNHEHRVLIVLNQEIIRYYTELQGVQLLNVGPMFSLTGIVKGMPPSTDALSNRRTTGERSIPGWAEIVTLLREEVHYRRLERRLERVIADNSADIMHAHLNSAIVLASRLRDRLDIPVVATLHGTTASRLGCPKGIGRLALPLTGLKRWGLSKALEKADQITAVSEFELSSVEKCGISIRHKSKVIPNGISLQEIQSTPASPDTLKGEFNLLFPGGARFVKGGDLVIKALPKVKERIKNVHLYVAGEVPQHHIMRKLVVANQLNTNVTFVGFLETQEYRKLLRSVDALVMPSREEGFGIAFLEAMALGKPVIAGDTGGVTEIIENGKNGLLVRPDPDHIADAILSVYYREDLRQRMIHNGMSDVTRFEWSTIGEEYIQLYNNTIMDFRLRK